MDTKTKKAKRRASIPARACVACGCCLKVCPKKAIKIDHGCFAVVDDKLCIGCGLCRKACPASIIELEVVS